MYAGVPEISPSDRRLLGGHREAEVRDPHAAAPVEHDVRGLEVAVEDALLVRRVQARAELARDLDGLVDGETPDPLEQRREVLAVHVLHREEVAAFDLADVVDAADVRVRDLPREPDLGVEAREEALVRGDRLGQELQGDGLSELQVVGAVDLAHAALAEEPDDAVALAEHGARRERAEVERARREAARRRTAVSAARASAPSPSPWGGARATRTSPTRPDRRPGRSGRKPAPRRRSEDSASRVSRCVSQEDF